MATSVVHGLAGPKVKGNFLQKGWPPVRAGPRCFPHFPPGSGPAQGGGRHVVPPFPADIASLPGVRPGWGGLVEISTRSGRKGIRQTFLSCFRDDIRVAKEMFGVSSSSVPVTRRVGRVPYSW